MQCDGLSTDFMSVAGGTPAETIQAIWRKYTPGCDYNGNRAFAIDDTRSWSAFSMREVPRYRRSSQRRFCLAVCVGRAALTASAC